ncbi:HNH endonuclease signature motif containing protein [Microbacterium sp. C7(2022)]|uniref:HNH endonuclease signature motif containing protein n=1 Tax=Microbacterium sp. C7(2022) TaxID=2992759 RepID=UPI00237AC70C|nr:HNH endonuclease signature motif containing protein [Microbacterium sp. C7(2022)]MDE0545408.1 HNH endonuclease [Microbacterium sp. C7(2022)]
MAIFSDIDALALQMRELLGDEIEGPQVPAALAGRSGDDLIDLVNAATALVRICDSICVAATGAIAVQSTREYGHSGVAQKRGHRNAVSLVQDLTGSTRADARKQVRIGEGMMQALEFERDTPDPGTLIESDLALPGDEPDPDATAPEHPSGVIARPRVWHAPADDALLAHTITTSQHDAIIRGLHAPVEPDPSLSPEDAEIARATAREAWSLAVEQLVAEAGERDVEELACQARTIRDLLDAAGAAERFDERFQRRSYRSWIDRDGVRRGTIIFDDFMGAWIDTILNSVLRPRRGGPTFVDSELKARAEELKADPRTNDQLAYDLLMDLLRAGALADAEEVFGTRQAGVRVVVTDEALDAGIEHGQGDPDDELVEPAADAAEPVETEGDPDFGAAEGDTGAIDADAASDAEADAAADAVAGEGNASHPPRAERHGVGHFEDGGASLPSWLIAQQACDVGTVKVTTDTAGNPLDLGREVRLFSAKQKIALAVRDGGCRWRDCDRPASYCEAHHIDPWVAENGRTDIDRGILLCRFHHMELHHGGWRITREGKDDFMLHPPAGRADRTPIRLPRRLSLQYAWAGIDPPPRRFRLAA